MPRSRDKSSIETPCKKGKTWPPAGKQREADNMTKGITENVQGPRETHDLTKTEKNESSAEGGTRRSTKGGAKGEVEVELLNGTIKTK